MTTQRLPRAQRRAQLLSVSTQMFADNGYRTTSMDDVAEAAGVSKPVLYQHFASKEDLYAAVIDEAADSFTATMASSMLDWDDSEKRVHATFMAFFTFVVEHRHSFMVLFRSDEYEPRAVSRIAGVRRGVANQIAELITRYTYATLEESLLIAHAVGGVAENAAIRLTEPDAGGIDPIRAARLLAFITFNGLAALPRVEDVERDPLDPSAARPWDVD